MIPGKSAFVVKMPPHPRTAVSANYPRVIPAITSGSVMRGSFQATHSLTQTLVVGRSVGPPAIEKIRDRVRWKHLKRKEAPQ